jgi:nucleoid-associated protein YgaU
MRLLKNLLFIILFWGLTLVLAQESAKSESQSEDPNTDFPYGNRGYLYYNPDIGEKTAGAKPVKASPKPTIEIPTKPKPIPILPKKPQPEKTKEAAQPVAKEEKAISPEEEVASLKAKLQETTRKLSLANQKIKELQEKADQTKTTQVYQVKKGDSLWSIAAKKEIYGDPYKWLLLYHANRDQIYDPHLIFPNMVLIIPRIDEYEKQR